MIRELRLTPQAAFVQPRWRDRFRDWREKHRLKFVVGAAVITAIVWTVAYA